MIFWNVQSVPFLRNNLSIPWYYRIDKSRVINFKILSKWDNRMTRNLLVKSRRSFYCVEFRIFSLPGKFIIFYLRNSITIKKRGKKKTNQRSNNFPKSNFIIIRSNVVQNQTHQHQTLTPRHLIYPMDKWKEQAFNDESKRFIQRKRRIPIHNL